MALSGPAAEVHRVLREGCFGRASIIFHPLPDGSRNPAPTAPYGCMAWLVYKSAGFNRAPQCEHSVGFKSTPRR